MAVISVGLDYSRVFDALDRKTFLPSFWYNILSFFLSCLSERKQGVRIKNIIFEVLQGSILGQLLFLFFSFSFDIFNSFQNSHVQAWDDERFHYYIVKKLPRLNPRELKCQ